MCLFPLPNYQFNSSSYKKGLIEFDCGACPECLSKRSSVWALRATYEAKSHSDNCMITLTYDNYLRDRSGRIIGELPPDRNLHVDKRDLQLFIKRLRKWYSKRSSEKIKYIACAEYGKRTHRAHYHVILFGVKFPDLVAYKKSSRGNLIYKSKILTDLWGHGICTVDSININSAVARYCTKYCAKSRSEDTFMLFSQKVGFEYLWKNFNGISYFVEGREYPIPRFIWNHYIMTKYSYIQNMTYKYLNRVYDSDRNLCLNEDSFEQNVLARRVFHAVLDSDPLRSSYLDYWRSKSSQFLDIPVSQRILQLPEKYHFYKVRALECLSLRSLGYPVPAPGSKCISAYERYKFKYRHSLADFPCLNTASDTDSCKILKFPKLRTFLYPLSDISSSFEYEFSCNLHKKCFFNDEQLDFYP